ncbi:hypothetical protein GGR56DRAFT_661621 [Xylariaceae sp. FL0804]|nr:hypothetical protein GGR56DRAFT_661621 [Xylariaceae sp. FL0804]
MALARVLAGVWATSCRIVCGFRVEVSLLWLWSGGGVAGNDLLCCARASPSWYSLPRSWSTPQSARAFPPPTPPEADRGRCVVPRPRGRYRRLLLP